MRGRRRLSPARLLAAWLPLLLLGPVAVGLAGTLLPAFGVLPALGGTRPTLRPFADLLAEPGLLRSVLLGLGTGLATTALSLAAVAAFLAARLARPGREPAAPALLAPLLAVPHAAAAVGLAFLIAPAGFLFRLAAPLLGFDRPPDLLVVGDRWGLALTLGLLLKEIPFLLLVSLAALPSADARRRIEAALALGRGPGPAFLFAVWPALYRRIRLPVLAVLAFSSSVVDVAAILGPSVPAPLAVRVLDRLRDPALALRFEGAAGALLQAGATAALLALWLGLERIGAGGLRRAAASGLWRGRPVGRGARALLAAPVHLAALLLLAGLALLALWSLAALWSFPAILPAGLTARNWSRALPGLAGPLANTLALAFAAAGAALVFAVALLEAVRHAAGPMQDETPIRLPPFALAALAVPLLVPQVAFLFGIEVALLSAGIGPGLAAVAAVHALFAAPYVVLALADPWFALDPRFERVAAALGRGGAAAFGRIRLPLLRAPILAAFAIGVSVSTAQYLPTVLVGAGRVPTLTTEAVALASGGNPRLVGATALLQATLPLLVFALCGWTARRRSVTSRR